MKTPKDIPENQKPAPHKPFQWRALTPVLALLSFAVLGTSGVVLWLAPLGRIANWTDGGHPRPAQV